MRYYESVSEQLMKRMEQEKAEGTFVKVAFDNDRVVRRDNTQDKSTVWRTSFVRDTDKIMHCPYYNRYADKTQVFSFYKNDDITHRSLHVQLVSRIGRTIGQALNLNTDLIEAIALGHDIGHTPFGHTGERFLDQLFAEHTGRHFSHNIHSVRVLDKIFPHNISLQTLDGIACHDGELELKEYCPRPLKDFEEFDARMEACYLDKKQVRKLIPSTLEGCVVRISDIIAYLGKDRQDAERIKLIDRGAFNQGAIGSDNPEIINNLMVNIIENSYGKPYIKMDETHFAALQEAKEEDVKLIYRNRDLNASFDETVLPMFEDLYTKLLSDLRTGRKKSPIFTHHIRYIENAHCQREFPYSETESNQLVVDYIASMTDDYFIDLHAFLFPDSKHQIVYTGYFD